MKIKLLTLICATAIIASSFTEKSDTVKQIVEHHFEALNKHDLNMLSAEYSSDVQFYSISWEGMKTGTDEVKTAYSRYWKTSPDLVYKITNVIYGDASATIEYETTGTMTNLEGGSPVYMQGKKYTLKNCTIIKVKNGKIVYDSTYFDQVAFLRQMDFFNQK
jgi:steroid delta-isomerase-like uncharacterized protein